MCNKMKFVETVVPKILSQLCSGSMSPTEHLEKQQALVKQFAEILEFVLKFDEYKVKCSVLYLWNLKKIAYVIYFPLDDNSVYPERF